MIPRFKIFRLRRTVPILFDEMEFAMMRGNDLKKNAGYGADELSHSILCIIINKYLVRCIFHNIGSKTANVVTRAPAKQEEQCANPSKMGANSKITKHITGCSSAFPCCIGAALVRALLADTASTLHMPSRRTALQDTGVELQSSKGNNVPQGSNHRTWLCAAADFFHTPVVDTGDAVLPGSKSLVRTRAGQSASDLRPRCFQYHCF